MAMTDPHDSKPPGDAKPTSPASEAELAERLKETRIPPELREWVRQQFPPEELLRGIQEVQANGGYSLADILEEFSEPESKDREHA